jgi:hypothetical protein
VSYSSSSGQIKNSTTLFSFSTRDLLWFDSLEIYAVQEDGSMRVWMKFSASFCDYLSHPLYEVEVGENWAERKRIENGSCPSFGPVAFAKVGRRWIFGHGRLSFWGFSLSINSNSLRRKSSPWWDGLPPNVDFVLTGKWS